MKRPRVAIIGAGMSGLCMAIRLRQAGIEDVTIYEKAARLGGTWRDNTYPGLSCDVPAQLYQFTFALNPNWSGLFAPGAEIWAYFDRVADEFGVREHIRFDTEIVHSRYDDGEWHVETAAGDTATYDFLVAATGILHHPAYPDIDGLDSFTGAVFHSARWDHSVPVAGQRVAVIGTGSTGVQIVCGLAGTAGHVDLYQRSAQWILPLPNVPNGRLGRLARRALPGLDRAGYAGAKALFDLMAPALTQDGWQRKVITRACRANLRTVRDPKLRAALTPDHDPMCRRLVISSRFYPTIQRPDVALLTDSIERIEPNGIRTRDGVLHPTDVIVLATGFHAHAYVRPMRLTGKDGLTLDEAWADGPRAYHTVGVPGFPNFFMLMGPHSPVGNYPLTAIAETQVEHVLHWIALWRRGSISTVAPTAEATRRFNEKMRRAAPHTIWASGCRSWYLGADGLPELWPWTPSKHGELLRTITIDDYEIAIDAPTTRVAS